MGLFSFFKGKTEQSRVILVSEHGNGFYAWNGKIYRSDIVRACIRPKVKAIGKLVGKHLRETVKAGGDVDLQVNPSPNIRFLLEEPNPYMTGQKLQEKLAAQLCLNNNAFALVIRDESGIPYQIYPIPALSAEMIHGKDGKPYIRFMLKNGKNATWPYSSIIHLRSDFNEDDVFGDPIAPALAPLMEIVNTTDQGIVKAIKNSSLIRWLLRFNQSMRPEDIERQTKQFADNFLSIDGGGYGVAGTDTKMDATQIEPKDYVPNAAQMDRTTQRIYSVLGTNEKIVQSKYNEDEWNAYWESELEPIAIEMSGEYTRKLFSRRERGCGNSIVFEAANLATASMSTKLNLCQMVDRGAMLPNEWRAVFNLAPVPGGDKPIRRLDTQVVNHAVSALSAHLGGDNDAAILATIEKIIRG